jgi:transcriptional repressor NrdR
MHCPSCGGETKVLDTRLNESANAVKRRRECLQCGKRFTTYERIENVPLVVRKKSGRTELFDRGKVLNGLVKACEKRPISVHELEAVTDEIERDLKNKYSEVTTTVIGETILKKLLTIDQVAYIRFASVYKDFSDIESFFKELENLKKSNHDQ